MVSIVLVCCINWLNKDLNSVRKEESWVPKSTGLDPEAKTCDKAEGSFGGDTGG